MEQGIFTDSQWLAINTHGCDLLVAAAAGSGKTAVLVERIIKIITDNEKLVNIDELLVLTFTKAAAAEMKQRIGDALTKSLETELDNVHLQNQLTLLNRANIKTIHSFCLQVIKEHYYLLGIDPQSRTADPSESLILQQETLDNLFEELYGAGDNQGFLTLVERFGEATGDKRLKGLLLQLYNFLLGCPYPKEWLIEKTKELELLQNGFQTATFMSVLMETIENEINFALYLLKTASELISDDTAFSGYFKTISEEMEKIGRFLLALQYGYNEAYDSLALLQFGRLSAYRGENKVLANEIKDFRNLAKKTLTTMAGKYFSCAPDISQKHLDRLFPVAKALCQVTLLFMERYQEAKVEKQLLDFGDYEHYCIGLLLEKGSTGENVIQTPVAVALSEEYYEILIDEYQDSNIIQEMILWAVSRKNQGDNNRFMVGDVKQSIYGFRLAAPELFMEKYNSFPTANTENKASKTKKIILSQNFRSRSNVLDGINFLFCQMMSEAVGGLSYDNGAALTPAMNFPSCDGNCGGANEILLVDVKPLDADDAIKEDNTKEDTFLEELSRREWEAQLIANRIKALFAEDFLVLDKNRKNYRPLEYGDMAILLRSTKSFEGVFEKIFNKEEIPYFAETAVGFFDSTEVVMILNFLQLIDNPMQDIPLMSVLHHTIYGFSADMLLEIRLQKKGGDKPYPSFYEALLGYVAKCALGNMEADENIGRKIESFLKDLEQWRNYSPECSISELLWYLYDATGYFDYVGVQAGGKLRQGNLRLLIEKAEQYEHSSRKGLFYFIKYIDQMKKTGADEVGGAKAEEGGNVVQIMTIHKSKGLEFPVVFVSDLGKNFNKMDLLKPLLLHKDLGLAFDDMDIENRVVFSGLLKAAVGKKLINQNVSEEMRVLYVALTRAKEKLILTGSVKDMEKQIAFWQLSAGTDTAMLPDFFMSRAKGYLDWIMPAFLRHSEAKPLWEEKQPPYISQKLMGNDSQWIFKCFPVEDMRKLVGARKIAATKLHDSFANWNCKKNYSGKKKEIYHRLSWKYPYEYATRLPSKISISEIKRRQYGEEEAVLNWYSAGTKTNEKTVLSPMEVGVAVHTFFEHADFTRHYTSDEIVDEIDKFCEMGIFSLEEAFAVNMKIEEIIAFFDSPLAERMRKNTIYKEQPFAMTMTPLELGFTVEEGSIINEEILINGIIDCYFYEDEHIILLDYKTDNIKKGQEALLAKRYGIQLSIYKEALERITGAKVLESYIYSVPLKKAILL